MLMKKSTYNPSQKSVVLEYSVKPGLGKQCLARVGLMENSRIADSG